MEKSLLALSVQVNGRPLREYFHEGHCWVEGRKGSEFLLQVRNRSYDRRILVLPSIDGLSVMDGQPASFQSGGYVLEPLQSINIPGWRLNDGEVAKFRFHKAGRSYAAQKGTPKNIGVIGCAVFSERPKPPETTWVYSSSSGVHLRGAGGTSHMNSMGGFGEALSNSVTCSNSGTTCDWYPVPPSQAECSTAEPSLGTEFGQRIDHRVESVPFERESKRPNEVVQIRYGDRQELNRRGIDTRQKPAVEHNPVAFPNEQGCKPPAGWNG